MPSVTMSTRVSAEKRRSKRTCQPTSRPRVQPCSSAIRRATERAATRRGCSTTTRPESATAGGTRVVLPVPGGATTTAARCEASAARTSGRLASSGSEARGTWLSSQDAALPRRTVEYSAAPREIPDPTVPPPEIAQRPRQRGAVPLLNTLRHGPHTNDGGGDDAVSLL